MNKRISAALCTVTAMAAVLAVPTAAQAADPYPKGFSAKAEYEKVVLFFDALPNPKNLKAHLRKKGTTARVATLTDFRSDVDPEDFCEPSCGDVLPYPRLALVPKLAELGEYSVDVEYTGTQGETILHKDKATLNYRQRPVFENLKSPNRVSLASPDTVVSGDLKLYDPRTRTYQPFAGGAFTSRTGRVSTPLTADAKGHFEFKATVSGPGYEILDGKAYTHVFLASELNGNATEVSTIVPLDTVQARLTLDSPTVTGAYGTQAEVGGTVTMKAADGTWKPAPSVEVLAGGAKVNTDGAGRFTVLPVVREDTTWPVRIAGPWVSDDSVDLKVDATAGTAFSAFEASVDLFKNVKVKARFDRVEIPAGVTSLKVDVQTSADGKTGWTTRKSVDVYTQPGTNPTADVETTVPYPGPAFVRLQYAGTPAIHGAETTGIKVQRTVTAIPEFNAAPEPVKKGQIITVTGKLNHADPTWKPFAGQTVNYYFRPTGTTGYKVMGTSKTAADGTFTKKFKAEQSGTWYAWYAQPDATHFYAASRMDEVVVTP